MSWLEDNHARLQRTYAHLPCKRRTTITDHHFVGMCNPYGRVRGTRCMHCGVDTLDQFIWTDTREPLDRWRERLRASVPRWPRLFRWWPALIGLVGGAAAGVWLGQTHGGWWWAATSLAIVGLIAGLTLSDTIERSVTGDLTEFD